MNGTFTHRICRGAALAAAVLATGAAIAADNTAQERFQRESAVCKNGQSQQDTETCMREARNALQASRQNDLTSQNVAALDSNAVARCDVFVAEERSACLARIQGPTVPQSATITRGSVNEGGVIRETIQVHTVPGTESPAAGAVATPVN